MARRALSDQAAVAAMIGGIDRVFSSLGRVVLCADPRWRVVHASHGIDAMGGDGTAASLVGATLEELLGAELFGSAGALRAAVEAGERREGWGATLQLAGRRPRRVSVTAAPLVERRDDLCDPGVAYVIVMRPAEEALEPGAEPGVIHFSGLVARSQAMQNIFRLIENLAESDATVLLSGESGTGKELVARAFHLHSGRRSGAFVAVNCAALPGELLESELFGHVRGAFTGAVRDRAGRFELAEHGTLFLDEIGDLPLSLQGKLLRVLQERTFERVGESRTRESDARILAATHLDLSRAVREGRFREDLYYRLRVVPVEVPPLRARREDVEPLTRHLLARAARRSGREVRLSPDALRALLAYDWPGNVRELENALEYALAVCRRQTILPEDLPAEARLPARSVPSPVESRPPAGSQPTAPRDERERLLVALEAARWRRDEAARALGLSRTTLWRRMRELGLGVSA